MTTGLDKKPASRDVAVALKASIGAAERLGLSAKEFARVIGVSEPTASRLRAGATDIRRDSKSFELAVLLARLYRGLDAIVGGDDTVAAAWMRNENTALHGKPAELIQDVTGLTNVIRYLDSRRAPL